MVSQLINSKKGAILKRMSVEAGMASLMVCSGER